MTEQAPPFAPLPRRAFQIGKVFAYFLLLIGGAKLLEEILRELARAQYAAELNRVSGMAASILNANKNVDDLIVTCFALTITFLLILPVSWVHTITKGDESDPSLAQTLIVLSVIVAGVMLMLEDNLARAFSLVGVVAAVRYRNTLKDPKDAVYVFLSLGIGMACGFQSYAVALVLSLFECSILLVLAVYRAGSPAPGAAGLLDPEQPIMPRDQMVRVTREAHEHLEPDPESQDRFLAAASRFANKKGKKPNAVITVQLGGTATAFNFINALIEDDRGDWRLLGTREMNGVTLVEYLGRVPKNRMPPLSFLERIRTADPEVISVSFQSLRGMGSEDAPGATQRSTNGHAPAPRESGWSSIEGKGPERKGP